MREGEEGKRGGMEGGRALDLLKKYFLKKSFRLTEKRRFMPNFPTHLAAPALTQPPPSTVILSLSSFWVRIIMSHWEEGVMCCPDESTHFHVLKIVLSSDGQHSKYFLTNFRFLPWQLRRQKLVHLFRLETLSYGLLNPKASILGKLVQTNSSYNA